MGLGSVGVGALIGAGALVEAQAFVLRRIEAAVLPSGSAPLKVLHISDIHLTPRQHEKLAFLRGVAALEPDLVVSTGDHLSSALAMPQLFDVLAPLLARPGAFVFGSNDFEGPHFRMPTAYLWANSTPRAPTADKAIPADKVRDHFVTAGWVDLDDARARLEIAGHIIELRGTGDAHVNQDHYGQVAGPADPQADLSLGVTHAPYRRVLDAMADDGVALILAGHTHGGQVCLPGGRPIVTNADIGPEYAKGLSTWTHEGHSSVLHVSAGLGSSPYAPYRLFCRPEATLLTLVSAPPKRAA
ncbi:metallophosphoesterase [Propionibacterium cyclohexanicum]|uniref:metallophosphoesterase n=1 Tax=Propionibacterium cyclohexanicum TaxID=64702 RepID=UPI003CCC1FA0